MDIPTFSCTHWALGSKMIAYVDYGKRLPALMQDCVPKARGARRLMASIAWLWAVAAGASTLANAQTSSDPKADSGLAGPIATAEERRSGN